MNTYTPSIIQLYSLKMVSPTTINLVPIHRKNTAGPISCEQAQNIFTKEDKKGVSSLTPTITFVPVEVTEEDKRWVRENCNNKFDIAQKVFAHIVTQSIKGLENYIQRIGKEEQEEVQTFSQTVYNIGLNRDIQKLEECYKNIKEQVDQFLDNIDSRFFKKKLKEDDFRNFQATLQNNSLTIKNQLKTFDELIEQIVSIDSTFKQVVDKFEYCCLYLKFILEKYRNEESQGMVLQHANNRLSSILVSLNLALQLNAHLANEKKHLTNQKQKYENLVVAFVPSYINSMYLYIKSLKEDPTNAENEYQKLIDLLKTSKI